MHSLYTSQFGPYFRRKVLVSIPPTTINLKTKDLEMSVTIRTAKDIKRQFAKTSQVRSQPSPKILNTKYLSV